MTKQLAVAWFGPQILLHIDVEPVEYPRVCHFVPSVFKRATMKDMITICFEVKLEGPVIVVIHPS